jgi:Rap1a immunity proteins
MRLLLVAALFALFLASLSASTGVVGLPAGTSPKSTPEQPDIGRSGRDFLEVCSSVDGGGNRDAARVQRDATCLGWVEGFVDGFLVHEELLSIPRRDRMACVPQGVTTIQIVRVIKKYLAENPGKARRPTRYIASLALAGTFPCKAGK